ncbi:MAG: type II toxin-antitoxin system HicA family toxin [Microcystis aeruginosa Ma_QC_Ca_00000000_S207]|uniref:Type II toxin-antitoxin system HicA family toxin n=1 Tax=Microcystis aeruginosa Ma_QC_Ca_00000000_S207 TaxID=2486251 RepID=A0A552FUF1_MICAE|nr:MAG: type II toxin-antitoxin system HicA family toxin [Microcystis aeruginosa Ma_QC_Ca_00000000_S207]
MSRLNPCKRRDFIKKLRKLGFEQPRSGTRHQFMIYQQYRLTIPSNSEYSVPQLKMMIKEVENIMSREITIDEWNEP